jgi:lysozyme
MTLGIDLSNNNGVVDLSLASECGVKIVVAKASEGLKFKDEYFARNVTHAIQNGLTAGGYDFARPSEATGAQEAAQYLSAIHGVAGVSFHCLDMEDSRVSPTAGLAAFVMDWYEHVHQTVPGPIYLYTSYDYARDHGLIGSLNPVEVRLWLAAWQVTEPNSFPFWPAPDAWQFSDEGFLPGVGRVDMSLWFTYPV